MHVLAERGIQAYQCYATADLGLVAYENSAREGLVLDEGVIVEIVRPGSGDPVAEGDVGELVVTTTSPTSPSGTGSPVPGRTISTITPSSSTSPSRASVS